MYVASYNDVAHNNGTAKGGLSTEYSTKNAPGYIYKVNGELYNSGWSTAEDSLDYKGYNSMYVEKMEVIGGWLLLRLTTLTVCAMWTVTTLAWTTTSLSVAVAVRTVSVP